MQEGDKQRRGVLHTYSSFWLSASSAPGRKRNESELLLLMMFAMLCLCVTSCVPFFSYTFCTVVTDDDGMRSRMAGERGVKRKKSCFCEKLLLMGGSIRKASPEIIRL